MARRRKAATTGGWLASLQGQGLEVRSSRDAALVPGWLDTGNYALNWAISGRFGGGYPLGHTVEIFGDPSTGKSFLVGRAVAMVQAANGVAMIDDVEGAYNVKWMETLGINVDHVAHAHSRTVKDHLKLTKKFIETFQKLEAAGEIKGPGLLACDSLASLSTDHELETQLDKRDMTKAGELKAFFRIVAGDLYGQQITYISTNHKTANIGNRFQKTTTSGGGGPKYQASVRIDLRGVSKLKAEQEGSDFVGVMCRAFIDKNRLAPPWKEVRLAIPFHQPISRASGLITVLLELGAVELRGQFLYYQGKSLGLRGYVSKKKGLAQDEAGERLLDQIPELLEETDVQLATSEPRALGSSYQEEVDDDDSEGE